MAILFILQLICIDNSSSQLQNECQWQMYANWTNKGVIEETTRSSDGSLAGEHSCIGDSLDLARNLKIICDSEQHIQKSYHIQVILQRTPPRGWNHRTRYHHDLISRCFRLAWIHQSMVIPLFNEVVTCAIAIKPSLFLAAIAFHLTHSLCGSWVGHVRNM